MFDNNKFWIYAVVCRNKLSTTYVSKETWHRASLIILKNILTNELVCVKNRFGTINNTVTKEEADLLIKNSINRYFEIFNEKKEISNMDIETGTVVELKSGGPLLTVEEVTADTSVRCVWFDKYDQMNTGVFNVKLLSEVSEKELAQLDNDAEKELAQLDNDAEKELLQLDNDDFDDDDTEEVE